MLFNTSNAKTAGALLFAGGTQFVVSMIIAEAVYPNYSVSANFISDLGVWGKMSAPVFNTSIVISGLLTLGAAFFIQKAFRKRGFSAIVALSGAGPLVVGFFPENTVLVNGIPVIHSLAALIAFIFGGLAAITSYCLTISPFKYFSAALGAISIIALVLFPGTINYGSLGLGAGGMERMIVYPTLLWVICFGGYLMAISEHIR